MRREFVSCHVKWVLPALPAALCVGVMSIYRVQHACRTRIISILYIQGGSIKLRRCKNNTNSAFTHWRQCACVHFLSAICDHKQREGCGRWVVGYRC